MKEKTKLELLREELFQLQMQIRLSSNDKCQKDLLVQQYEELLKKYQEESWRRENEKYQ